MAMTDHSTIRYRAGVLATGLACCYFSLFTVTGSLSAQESESDQEPVADAGQAELSAARYIEAIFAREQEYGAFDPELGELLLGLGVLYKNRGDYAEAAEALDRALHIKKVNEGLESMTQIPILNALIETNTAAQNWDELDVNYQTLLWIHQRRLESDDPSILPVIDLVGRWKLAAFNNRLLDERPFDTLQDLSELYKTTIGTLEKIYGETDQRLLIPLKGLAISQYEYVNYMMTLPVDEFGSATERPNISHRICSNMVVNGVLQYVCRDELVPNPRYLAGKQDMKNNLVATNLRVVRDTLVRIKEIYETNKPPPMEDYVLSLLDLGDWYFLNAQRGNALNYYGQAHQVLLDNQADEITMQKFFGKPVLIPALGRNTNDESREQEKLRSGLYVRLAFEVYMDGNARQVEVIEESDPKNYRARKNAREYIKNSLFRPQLVDGKPVTTAHTELVVSGNILK